VQGSASTVLRCHRPNTTSSLIRVGILGYIAKILHEVEMALIDLPHPSSLLTDLTRISSTSAESDSGCCTESIKLQIIWSSPRVQVSKIRAVTIAGTQPSLVVVQHPPHIPNICARYARIVNLFKIPTRAQSPDVGSMTLQAPPWIVYNPGDDLHNVSMAFVNFAPKSLHARQLEYNTPSIGAIVVGQSTWPSKPSRHIEPCHCN
jgi:hypothetical protein